MPDHRYSGPHGVGPHIDDFGRWVPGSMEPAALAAAAEYSRYHHYRVGETFVTGHVVESVSREGQPTSLRSSDGKITDFSEGEIDALRTGLGSEFVRSEAALTSLDSLNKVRTFLGQNPVSEFERQLLAGLGEFFNMAASTLQTGHVPIMPGQTLPGMMEQHAALRQQLENDVLTRTIQDEAPRRQSSNHKCKGDAMIHPVLERQLRGRSPDIGRDGRPLKPKIPQAGRAARPARSSPASRRPGRSS